MFLFSRAVENKDIEGSDPEGISQEHSASSPSPKNSRYAFTAAGEGNAGRPEASAHEKAKIEAMDKHFN